MLPIHDPTREPSWNVWIDWPMDMVRYVNGTAKTTQIGYVNKHRQVCLGTCGEAGNHSHAKAYKMHCSDCGYVYYANGCDVWERKCEKCAGLSPR